MVKYNTERFINQISIQRKKENRDAFFQFFDGGRTADGAFLKASDIFQRLMLPYAGKYLGNLKNKTSLDIGYGSGCQLLEASRHFKTAMGIDVHKEKEYVQSELESRGCFNHNLMVCDGVSIPVPDTTIDFIHSFVTFIHVVKIKVVIDYLKEIQRVLKPGGISVLFFSRILRTGSKQTQAQYLSDVVQEEVTGKTFRESTDNPSMSIWTINLVIAMYYMKKLVEDAGLETVANGASHTMNNKIMSCGGQHFVVIRKIL